MDHGNKIKIYLCLLLSVGVTSVTGKMFKKHYVQLRK